MFPGDGLMLVAPGPIGSKVTLKISRYFLAMW
jgi:hypothetical protein